MNAKDKYDIVAMLEKLTYEQKLDFLQFIKALQAEEQQQKQQASTNTSTDTNTSTSA